LVVNVTSALNAPAIELTNGTDCYIGGNVDVVSGTITAVDQSSIVVTVEVRSKLGVLG